MTKIKKEDLLDLVKALNYFKMIGFVHADINRKNIIYTEDGFKIIDYEPSLTQIKNKKKQLLITIPYVQRMELDNETVTEITDKIGFFYFILRINNGITTKDIVSLSRHFNHEKYIGLNEVELGLISYEELLDRALSCCLLFPRNTSI